VQRVGRQGLEEERITASSDSQETADPRLWRRAGTVICATRLVPAYFETYGARVKIEGCRFGDPKWRAVLPRMILGIITPDFKTICSCVRRALSVVRNLRQSPTVLDNVSGRGVFRNRET
jgi:hypothetical protein